MITPEERIRTARTTDAYRELTSWVNSHIEDSKYSISVDGFKLEVIEAVKADAISVGWVVTNSYFEENCSFYLNFQFPS